MNATTGRKRRDLDLRDLPDVIALARERGLPIVVPMFAEPPEHVVRLFETLGVEWFVDPVGAARIRDELVDEIEKRWCPRCREWGLPHSRTGLCLFCDGAMQDAPPTNEREEHTMSTTVASSTACKVDGCTSEALQQYGRYGRLCAKHMAEAKHAANANGGGTGEATPRSASGDHVASVRALLKPAKALDIAERKLANIPTGERARAELAEAMRHVQASPTAANLERLAKATKAMSKGQPQRQKLQTNHDAALRSFKTAVGQLARDLAESS